MSRLFLILIFSLSLFPLHPFGLPGDDGLNAIINSVYKKNQDEEAAKKKLARYSYERRMDITESDEDGTLEKQYKTLQRVYQLNSNDSRTETVSSSKWEDGKWENTAKKEKDGDHKNRKFKLEFSDIFSPQKRSEYNFELIKQNEESIIIEVKPRKPEVEKFKGKFWFDPSDFSLQKAELQPSEFKTGLKNMNTYLEMKQINGISFLSKMVNKIHIKVFLIYSGKINQVINYDNYKFNIDEKTFNDTYAKLK